MLKICDGLDSDSFYMELNYKKVAQIIFRSVDEFFRETKGISRLIFIDPVVLANHESFLEVEKNDPNITLVPTNLHESNKDMESLTSILNVLETQGVGRRGECVCAVGGGALLDSVSFAASVFRRGVSVVKIPTTLLGVVDASIGVKTGINFKGQRNRVGSYHFDYKVIIDPSLLRGLHRGLVRQGLSEIIKIAIIKSRTLFEKLKVNKNHLESTDFFETREGISVMRSSIELMLEELRDNPREDNLLRCVDYGHSFSPLVEMESISRVGCKSLPHGYAVAYDCALTATIANERRLLSDIDFQEIIELLLSYNFDFSNDIYSDHNLLWASFLEMTKHRGGNQNLPAPTAIGSHTFIQDLTFQEMKHSATLLRKRLI